MVNLKFNFFNSKFCYKIWDKIQCCIRSKISLLWRLYDCGLEKVYTRLRFKDVVCFVKQYSGWVWPHHSILLTCGPTCNSTAVSCEVIFTFYFTTNKIQIIIQWAIKTKHNIVENKSKQTLPSDAVIFHIDSYIFKSLCYSYESYFIP